MLSEHIMQLRGSDYASVKKRGRACRRQSKTHEATQDAPERTEIVTIPGIPILSGHFGLNRVNSWKQPIIASSISLPRPILSS